MATFRVEVNTTGREVYLVEAESAEQAEDTWFNGEIVTSEVWDSEVAEIQIWGDDDD